MSLFVFFFYGYFLLLLFCVCLFVLSFQYIYFFFHINRTAITELAMQGGHATCNATVAGALLGCKVGYSELPRDWIDGLLPRQVAWLNTKINCFLDMMALP